jgi:hypothetical protein
MSLQSNNRNDDRARAEANVIPNLPPPVLQADTPSLISSSSATPPPYILKPDPKIRKSGPEIAIGGTSKAHVPLVATPDTVVSGATTGVSSGCTSGGTKAISDTSLDATGNTRGPGTGATPI